MVTNILKILLCISLDYKLVPVLCRENEYGRLQQKDIKVKETKMLMWMLLIQNYQCDKSYRNSLSYHFRTLGARGFSCVVSGIAKLKSKTKWPAARVFRLRPAKLLVAREKKPFGTQGTTFLFANSE